MKNPLLTAPCFLALVMTMAFTQCSTPPPYFKGEVLSQQVYFFHGRKFLQQRVVLGTDPFETELRSMEIPSAR